MNYQKKFQKLQEEFLSAVRLHPEKDFLGQFKNHPLKSRLDDHIFFRFKAYNTSYYARLCNVMADHLFDSARDLIGDEVLYDLLLEYYVSIPVSNMDMMDTARGFPEFLKKQKSDVLVKYPCLPDLCQLSLHYWDLIFDADEIRPAIKESDLSSLDPSDIFLTQNHVYFRSEYPFSLSSRGLTAGSIEEEDVRLDPAVKPRDDTGKPRDDTGKPRDDTGKPRDDTGKPRDDTGKPRDDTGKPRDDINHGILLLKTDGIDFDSLNVPKSFFCFTEKLSAGCSLDQAIESGFEDEQDLDVHAFQQWIALLVQKGALRLAQKSTF
jgi:RPE4 domain-containing protein